MNAFPKIKTRGFEVAAGWEDKGVTLPSQGTAYSAGYDFIAPVDTEIPVSVARDGSIPPVLVPTGIKAYMRPGEFLMLANRSSNPKKGLLLANGLGVVDSDYYQNPMNDGHIMFAFWNLGDEPVIIKRGDRIGQGVFLSYLPAETSVTTAKRKGGFGSTDDWHKVVA